MPTNPAIAPTEEGQVRNRAAIEAARVRREALGTQAPITREQSIATQNVPPPPPASTTQPPATTAPAGPSRDIEAEKATIQRLGDLPQTEEEVLNMAQATYGDNLPAEFQELQDRLNALQGTTDLSQQGALGALGQDISQFGQGALAAQGQAEQEGAMIQPQLNVLQEALKMKSGVGNQALGQADIFGKAGLTGYGALNASLQARGQEMDQKYQSFSNTVKSIADVQYGQNEQQLRSAENALNQYGLLQDEYKFQQGRLDEIAQREQDFARQIQLAEYEHNLSLDEMNYKFQLDSQSAGLSWEALLNGGTNGVYMGTDGSTYVQGGYATTQYVDGQKAVIGTQGQEGIPGSQFANNCVKYVRDQWMPDLPFGMDSISGRAAVLKEHGFKFGEQALKVGDAVVTEEGEWGHTAVVTGFTEDGKMVLTEANYSAGTITSGRILDPRDSLVMGFIENKNGPKPRVPTFMQPSVGLGVNKSGVMAMQNEGLNSNGAETFTPSPNYSTNDLGNAFQNALNARYGLAEPEKVNTGMMNYVSNYLISGRIPEAKALLLDEAISDTGLGMAEQDKLRGSMEMRDQLVRIQGLMGEFKAAGGQMGIFSGNIERAANRLGEMKDPKLSSLGTQLNQALISYRKSVSGSAFTESEKKDYERLFPSVTTSYNLATNKIDALTASFDSSLRSQVSNKIGGDEVYDKIFGIDTAISERGFSNESASTLQEVYHDYYVAPFTQ